MQQSKEVEGKKKFQQFQFCIPCKRNHNQGKQHIYLKTHQENLSQLIEKQLFKLSQCKKNLLQPKLIEKDLVTIKRKYNETINPNFWCVFCNKEIDETKSIVICYQTLNHLSTDEHIKAVNNFCNKVGIWNLWKLKGNTPKKGQKIFSITKKQWLKFETTVKNLLDTKNQEIKEVENKKEQEIQKLIEYSHSLPDSYVFVPTSTQNSLFNEQVIPKEPKTIISSQGILQNPTGFHQGQRVWGGGIVKYNTPDEWLPWPIDLLGDGNKIEDTNINNVNERKQTEVAYAENLTCVSIPILQPGEGNIHTGAPPPWLQKKTTTTTSIPTATTGSNLIEDMIAAIEKKKQDEKEAKNPKRIGATFLAQKRNIHLNKNWLPSFGGVWNEGRRSEHKRNYNL